MSSSLCASWNDDGKFNRLKHKIQDSLHTWIMCNVLALIVHDVININ